PCKLNPKQLKVAADWLDDYRQFWQESFDRLDDYLQKLKKERKQNATKGKSNVRNKSAKS
ncbi:MAG: transcriptional regulator, partial [Chthonomonadales bacterium]